MQLESVIRLTIRAIGLTLGLAATAWLGAAMPGAAASIDPGFMLFSMETAGDPLGVGLGTGWVGDPDKISDTSGKVPPPGLQDCGPGKFDFGDGKGCVSTGNAALIIERTQPMADAPPSNHSFIDIVGLSLRSSGDIMLGGVNVGGGWLRVLEGLDRVHGAADVDIWGGELIGGAGPTACDPTGASPHGCMEIDAGAVSYSLSHRAALILDSGRIEPVDFNAHGFGFMASSEAPDGNFVIIDGINLNLNGFDHAGDLWPVGGDAGGGFGLAAVPLPAPVLLLLAALLPLALLRRTGGRAAR